MTEWITWVFDGIGSTIFSIAVSALIGGAIGYKIGIHKNVKQKQIGGNSAKQRQEFTLENEDVSKAGGKIKTISSRVKKLAIMQNRYRLEG